MSHSEICPVCRGEGKIKKAVCHGCDGKGWIEVKDETLDTTALINNLPLVVTGQGEYMKARK